MEVPLPVILVYHSGLLQEVTKDVATYGGTLWTGHGKGIGQGD